MIICISVSFSSDDEYQTFPVPNIRFNPETYQCIKCDSPIVIDGIIDSDEWEDAVSTGYFVDIEGFDKPKPRFRTCVKMLWDDDYFYIAALIEEPHVWGTLTERDSVIYHDNDFEVLIDPDGDTHNYYELEINALNTQWDLFLTKPYRDDGHAINSWDIQGLKTAVHVDGEYVKKKNPDTGENLPEDNWVWSPQGLIAMHYPEIWGIVQFSETKQIPCPNQVC